MQSGPPGLDRFQLSTPGLQADELFVQLVSGSTAVATVHNLATTAWIHAAYKRAGKPVYTQLACQRSRIETVYLSTQPP